MAGSFVLTLDTTGPNIKIYGPPYATIYYPEGITVEGNERLANYQDFYFIDAENTEHKVILQHNGTHFYGDIDFSNFALGPATMYARTMDIVNNPSNTAIYVTNIINATDLKIELNDSVRDITAIEKVRPQFSRVKKRVTTTRNKARGIAATEATQPLGVKDNEYLPNG